MTILYLYKPFDKLPKKFGLAGNPLKKQETIDKYIQSEINHDLIKKILQKMLIIDVNIRASIDAIINVLCLFRRDLDN